jgi:hypothetical protein
MKNLFPRDALVVALLYAGTAAVCTQVPLLHALGYESSLVFALLGSLAAAFLTVGRLVHVYREPALDPGLVVPGTLRALRGAFLINSALLVIPLVILLANAVFVRNCSILEGILFFVLLPGVSALFSTALAFFCTMHYRWPRTAFVMIGALTLLYALALGYYTPAIFSYNFFYGYFPGFTYDEGLQVTGTLVSFRILTLGLGVVFLWLGYLLLTRVDRTAGVVKKGVALLRVLAGRDQRGLSVLVLSLAVASYMFRCQLGYESTSGYIRSQLGGVLRTEHFDIYYPQGLVSDGDLSRLVDEHEFRFAQLMQLFSLRRFGRIESYIYPSADVKLKLMGAGNTDIAKPWSMQIHVTLQSALATVQHELTHVMAGRFGWPVIHASPSVGLTEGLAMAVEWNYGARTLHEYSAAMEQLRIAPNIERILTPMGFVTQAPAISYVLAGSFCRYLIDKYGIRPFLLVYGGRDWKVIYGRPVPILVQEWRTYLRRYDVDQTDLAATKAFFTRPSIFQKTCPRVIGERNSMAVRAVAAGQYAVAESLYSVSYAEGKGIESLAGLLRAALRRGAYDSVVVIFDRAQQADGSPDRFLPLSLLLGDALWGLDSTAEAADVYRTLRFVDLTDAYTEAASVRLMATGDIAFGERFRRYFLTFGPDSVRHAILDSLCATDTASTLPRYLRGRELLRLNRYTLVIAELSAISLADIDPLLESFRLNSLGLACYFTGDFENARAWFWRSLNYDDSDMAKHSVNDWIDRCEWREHPHE